MGNEEYLVKLKKESKEELKRRRTRALKKILLSLVFFFGVFGISALIMSFFKNSLDTLLANILLIIPEGLMLMALLSFLFNTLGLIFASNKEEYAYLSGEKKFGYPSVVITKKIFDYYINTLGFIAMYTRINDKIFYLETTLKRVYAKGEKTEIGDCYINFSKELALEEFLDYEIDGTKIRDIQEFEVLSVNNDNPEIFVQEYEKFSKIDQQNSDN